MEPPVSASGFQTDAQKRFLSDRSPPAAAKIKRQGLALPPDCVGDFRVQPRLCLLGLAGHWAPAPPPVRFGPRNSVRPPLPADLRQRGRRCDNPCPSPLLRRRVSFSIGSLLCTWPPRRRRGDLSAGHRLGPHRKPAQQFFTNRLRGSPVPRRPSRG